MHVLLKFTNIDLKEQALLSDPPTKIGNDVISLLWQLLCQHNTAHDKFSSLSDKARVIVFPHRSLLMATSFVRRLGTYWPWKSQSSYPVITEQAVSALYIKLLQNDRFRPPLVYPFAASRPPLSESGYIAFMVTSSRRRHMWWARKASARGMHGRCTWQVAEINKKWGLGKEWIERCLMQEAWKKNHISALCTFWKTTTNVILTISWTLCLSVSEWSLWIKELLFPYELRLPYKRKK